MKLIYSAAVVLAFSSLMFKREVTIEDLRATLETFGKTPSKGQLRAALR